MASSDTEQQLKQKMIDKINNMTLQELGFLLGYGPFISSASNWDNGVPDRILVCPALGLDYSIPYERMKVDEYL